MSKNVLCKEYTYVQKYINGKGWENGSHRRYGTNLIIIIFYWKPVFTVKIIEARLNEINLERVQKKREKLSSHEHEKDITVQHKKER